MPKKRAMKLAVYSNGIFQGYVKSINYTRGTFSMIKTLTGAKNYDYDLGAYDIDFLTRIYGNVYGYSLV